MTGLAIGDTFVRDDRPNGAAWEVTEIVGRFGRLRSGSDWMTIDVADLSARYGWHRCDAYAREPRVRVNVDSRI